MPTARPGPRAGLAALALAALLVLGLAPAAAWGAGRPGPEQRALTGLVTLADGPVARATVQLLATDPGGGPPATLATARTNPAGRFTLPRVAAPAAGSVLYVVAEHPHLPVVLVDVLGESPAKSVTVTERTTVAAAYAFARFATGTSIAGSERGVRNAVGTAHNLADPTTGGVGDVLARRPNGDATETLATFNSVANLLAVCTAGAQPCASLLRLASTPDGDVPVDTFTALVTIARYPWQRVPELAQLAASPPAPNQPARSTTPAAWTLALRFVGDGTSVNGPGNFVIDHLGTVWATNNYEFSLDPFAQVCGSHQLLRFAPDGRFVPGSPYSGAGLDGAGFGITLDPYGDVWAGNFGFAAQGCEPKPAGDTVSRVRLDGTPVTVGTGYSQGGIDKPQGTESTADGDIWVANCGNGTVTIYPNGDPDQARSVDTGLTEPFDIAFAPDGTAYVTAVTSGAVAVLDRDAVPLPGSPVRGLSLPLGVATDSTSHAWVSDSGTLVLPCGDGGDPAAGADPSSRGSVSLLTRSATGVTRQTFTGGGLTLPWGIAVDGADNVWVANFGGRRLSEFCGTAARDCRPGTVTGAAISPDTTGYSFDGLVRNTGVAVDPSGNVWLANNWKEDPPARSNPGGYEVVAFVGLAEPVQRPAPLPRPAG